MEIIETLEKFKITKDDPDIFKKELGIRDKDFTEETAELYVMRSELNNKIIWYGFSVNYRSLQKDVWEKLEPTSCRWENCEKPEIEINYEKDKNGRR